MLLGDHFRALKDEIRVSARAAILSEAQLGEICFLNCVDCWHNSTLMFVGLRTSVSCWLLVGITLSSSRLFLALCCIWVLQHGGCFFKAGKGDRDSSKMGPIIQNNWSYNCIISAICDWLEASHRFYPHSRERNHTRASPGDKDLGHLKILSSAQGMMTESRRGK